MLGLSEKVGLIVGCASKQHRQTGVHEEALIFRHENAIRQAVLSILLRLVPPRNGAEQLFMLRLPVGEKHGIARLEVDVAPPAWNAFAGSQSGRTYIRC